MGARCERPLAPREGVPVSDGRTTFKFVVEVQEMVVD